MRKNVYCPYCGGIADLVTGSKIYPHRMDLFHKYFYLCNDGHAMAYVGCHPDTTNPLGRLADAELRELKSIVHQTFDPLWRNGEMSRSDAYKYLASQLDIKPKDCHIGMFDVAMCKKAIDKLKS